MVTSRLAPLMNPVPVIVTVPDVPFGIEGGAIDTRFGPTAKAAVFVTVPVSGFVTVRSRAPVGAFAAIVTLTVSCVALLRVVWFTVMPVPENEAAAPTWKF